MVRSLLVGTFDFCLSISVSTLASGWVSGVFVQVSAEIRAALFLQNCVPLSVSTMWDCGDEDVARTLPIRS